jgi:uncharacterized protein (DUF1499 family)
VAVTEGVEQLCSLPNTPNCVCSSDSKTSMSPLSVLLNTLQTGTLQHSELCLCMIASSSHYERTAHWP